MMGWQGDGKRMSASRWDAACAAAEGLVAVSEMWGRGGVGKRGRE